MHKNYFRFLTALVVIMSIYASTMAQSSGFNVANMDRSADACDDFFQYANGSWVKNTEIPPSQSRWGSFNILAENNREVLHSILEDAAKKKAPKGSDTQMIGDYYASCMDEPAIEKAGTTPLSPYLDRIAKIRTNNDLPASIAWMHKNGVPALFRVGGGPDAKNSNMVIVNAGQGGLSLPNKDYYTKTDKRSVEIREKFVNHMANIFKLLGDDADTAAREAQTVMDLQTRLANASKAPVELRDRDKNYNKIPVADAQKFIPNLNLAAYLSQRGMPPVKEINFGQPEFFAEVNKMMTDVPVDTWKTYFRWMFVSSVSNTMPKRFIDEDFEFTKLLTGVKEQQPRWKRCVAATDQALGEALGAVYVKSKFTPEAKSRMDGLITNLFAAMKTHIQGLAWMGSETKQKAIVKLQAYKRKIGYNDHPRGYAGLTISRASYAQNDINSGLFQLNRNIQDIGKPTDKTRWGMSPPTVNAYYNSSYNEIVFPAGILQPPFFNFQADDAINYGGIGAVIGHEISHGFDDQGSKSDAEGNLVSWWTADDRTKFESRAQCVVDQFNGYEVLPGLNVNGKLTLGENIGDLGGLNIAYTALMNSLEGKPRPAAIDGFTPEQRFFLGWAQVWAAKSTPEAERAQVLGDPHSAARWRVNGPTSNMPEFAKAFGCKAPQKMVRTNACSIW